ncbi:unnamed protein product [Closterium sp. NIES-65]|nr:unnamed protein product [Closterium sp. NIES-65]
MTDCPTPASHGGDGRPVERTPTSNPSSTLLLLYDLDPNPGRRVHQGHSARAHSRIYETTQIVGTDEAGPSSVPDGASDQDEECDDASSSSDDDDEDNPWPRRGAGLRTLEEKLKGERAFIEDLLNEDELQDLLNTAVPREHWKAADFVEEDMVYAHLSGASIREITLPYIFLYRLASTSLVNLENQPVVMVIAARNSKTSKDAHIQQSYAAWHLEAELCAVGETGLWLHFILDRIGQFHGVDLIPPVDTSTRERWYKKHMFFARNDEEQNELPAASHQQWTRQMWKTNRVFYKRNVHAARAGRAQELAIDGTYRVEIAELGHWAINKMTRAYITAIPVGVVMKKAGYSGAKQDYFLGRSRVPPFDELLELIAEHIFPSVDDLLKKVF